MEALVTFLIARDAAHEGAEIQEAMLDAIEAVIGGVETLVRGIEVLAISALSSLRTATISTFTSSSPALVLSTRVFRPFISLQMERRISVCSAMILSVDMGIPP